MGCFESLRPFNNISIISRLGSRRCQIAEIIVVRPGFKPWTPCYEDQEFNHYTNVAPNVIIHTCRAMKLLILVITLKSWSFVGLNTYCIYSRMICINYWWIFNLDRATSKSHVWEMLYITHTNSYRCPWHQTANWENLTQRPNHTSCNIVRDKKWQHRNSIAMTLVWLLATSLRLMLLIFCPILFPIFIWK